MKKLTTLAMGILLLVTLSSVALAEVKIWSYDELQTIGTSGKIILTGLVYKSKTTKILGSPEETMKIMKDELGKKGIANAYISFEGERVEHSAFFVKTPSYVVEAVEFELLEPTMGNIDKVLEKDKGAPFEVKLALTTLAKSAFAKEYAPTLLEKINNPSGIFATNTELGTVATQTYATIMKQEGIEGLRNVLTKHPVAGIQLAAGKELINLGDKEFVKNFANNGIRGKSHLVKSLQKELGK